MNSLADQLREAALSCTDTIGWRRAASPAVAFRALADACDELGVDGWDTYTERGAVPMVEAQVAELLGKPAAAFFPSGTMAQQAALRVWCDRAGTTRVALPDLSHLLVHELDGPRLIHGLDVTHLTTGREVATATHLAAIPGRLAAVLAELPLRDAGCLLPTWEELAELSQACRERGIALHFDGARLWESRQFYDRSLAEIAGLADSVYASFYKGLGGLAGACLAGPADMIEEARVWRKRLGGTIFRMTPEAVGALVGLRDRLPKMDSCVAWARALAAAVSAEGVTVNPNPPHTNTFELFAAGDADAVNTRLLAVMTRDKLALSNPWTTTTEPGRLRCELAIGDGALALDPVEIASRIAGLLRD